MNEDEVKRATIEHGLRLDALDRLASEHNKELSALRSHLESLRADLNGAVAGVRQDISKVTNRLILAMILVAVLGENAIPLLMRLSGA